MRQRERSKQVWAKWRELVSEQGRSGQSVAVFCRERGLCAPHFYAWKKRLREADGGQGEVRAPLAKFVEVKLVPAGLGLAGAGRDAGAASVSRAAGDARVEVLLKNGRSLRVGPGFDAELVRALVAVVESAA
jgi:hypothetical protein